MAFYAHPDVLDNGIAYIRTNCNKMAAISGAYTAGTAYATVSGNILAEAAMTSGDFTLGDAGSNRTLTTAAGKSDADAAATGAVTHFAFLDTTTSKVLWVTEESTGQTITAGNPVNFPQLVYTAQQPVAA